MSIKEKLEKGIYRLENAPRLIDMSGHAGIFINKNAPYPDEIESLKKMDWLRDKVKTHKLKAKSYGDWGLDISIIHRKHFENREKLEEMFLFDSGLDSKIPLQNIETISIQNALRYLGVKFSINMEFYLKNKNEIEVDLKRNVSDSDLKDELSYKKIKQELFYNQMLKIFGDDKNAAAEDTLKMDDDDQDDSDDDEDDGYSDDDDDTLFEKSFNLKEFHKYLNGNYMYGSAIRGDYYVLINWVF